jgi:hypothetical protein
MVNASFRWLNNVSGVQGFLASYWSAGFEPGIGPCFPLAGGLCIFYANAVGKRPIQRQPLLVLYKQQANPLLPTHNYTPPVISGNDKVRSIS